MSNRFSLVAAALFSALSLASCASCSGSGSGSGNNGAAQTKERKQFDLEDEQKLSNYVFLLTTLEDLDAACASVEKVLIDIETQGTAEVFRNVTGMLEKYLYDPNSPFRDEDIYSAVAQRILLCRFSSDEDRTIASGVLKMTSMNRRGTQANDFIYRDIRGKDHRLYETKADFTLLFFSNPGCPACKEIMDILSSDQHLLMLQVLGKLSVVNVYIDEDLDAWKEYQKEYPEYWSCGYDPSYSIRRDVCYNVRAIPSLYILGRDKTVLLKDPSNERAFSFLSRIPEE